MNWVSIGSSNGLSPFRRQAITRTNADFLSIGLEEQISVKFELRYTTFLSLKNTFENVVYKLAAILCRGRGVKGMFTREEQCLIYICHGTTAVKAGVKYQLEHIMAVKTKWKCIQFAFLSSVPLLGEMGP